MSAFAGTLRSTISPDIGLADLGTANTVVYERGAGVIVSEPSVVAYDAAGDIIAIGRPAKEMEGRAPSHLRIVRPISRGSISDFRAAQTLIARLVDRALAARPRFAPRLIACVPGCATDIECKAVEQAVKAAGARYFTFVPQAVAAAVGAELDIATPRAQMVVDIGGGTTEIAVLCLYGVIRLASVPVGGDSARPRHHRPAGGRPLRYRFAHGRASENRARLRRTRTWESRAGRTISGLDLRAGAPRDDRDRRSAGR